MLKRAACGRRLAIRLPLQPKHGPPEPASAHDAR
jgi:hypothetical protein